MVFLSIAIGSVNIISYLLCTVLNDCPNTNAISNHVDTGNSFGPMVFKCVEWNY